MADTVAKHPFTGRSVIESCIQASNLSSIYAMIPSIVRSRISVLSSLRCSERASTIHRPVPRAPLIPDNERIQELDNSRSSSATPSRSDSPERAGSLDVLRFGANISDTRSGINWETSSTGVQLWLVARAQAANDINANPALLRSMHIDAIRYMNMALPPDLSVSELKFLNDSLPEQLRTQQAPVQGARIVQEPPPRNFLRRSVSQTVLLLFAIMTLLMPYLINLLNVCLNYERRHHLSERLLANGMVLADNLGELGLEARNATVRFANGPTGAVLAGASFWVVDGLVGGLADGLLEVQKPAKEVETSG
jgi:hypothetical protein